MKSYPSNFKKFDIHTLRNGMKCLCQNHSVVEITSVTSDSIWGCVTYVPPDLAPLCKNSRSNARWKSDGSKIKAERWPPGMNLVKSL